MKKALVTTLFLLVLNPSLGFAKKYIEVSKEMPIELNLMVQAIQQQDSDAYSKIYSDIESIDRSAQLMSKEDILLIAKTEIYKSLLKSTGPVIKSPINGTSVDLIEKSIRKSSDPFLKWFLAALLKDTKTLISDPLYTEFLLQKNNDLKIEKIEHKRLEKKGELLQQWVSKLNPESEDFPMIIREELKKKIFESIRNIASSYKLLFIQINPAIIPLSESKELKYFTVLDREVPTTVNKQNPPTTDKTVEQILSPVINDAPVDLPLPSDENWLENLPESKPNKNLPKPSNDADWLQDF